MLSNPSTYLKAIAAAIVSAAAYLTGVVPAEGGFGDVSTVQWLGLIVFLGGAFGITYGVSNADTGRDEWDHLNDEPV